MRRLIFWSLSFLFIVGCSPGVSSDSTDPNACLVESAPDKDIVIKLPSNPTTGYSWRLATTLSESLSLKTNTYQQASGVQARLGVGGFEIWTFTALKKDTVELRFEYARPWEKDIPPIKTKTVTIRIR